MRGRGDGDAVELVIVHPRSPSPPTDNPIRPRYGVADGIGIGVGDIVERHFKSSRKVPDGALARRSHGAGRRLGPRPRCSAAREPRSTSTVLHGCRNARLLQCAVVPMRGCCAACSSSCSGVALFGPAGLGRRSRVWAWSWSWSVRPRGARASRCSAPRGSGVALFGPAGLGRRAARPRGARASRCSAPRGSGPRSSVPRARASRCSALRGSGVALFGPVGLGRRAARLPRCTDPATTEVVRTTPAMRATPGPDPTHPDPTHAGPTHPGPRPRVRDPGSAPRAPAPTPTPRAGPALRLSSRRSPI
ncbi:hypothetical protein HNR16_001115 [Pseudoclavibacter chungangensis]|nr:hypothetical protein [Pseudoclavibacter chungangensis]